MNGEQIIILLSILLLIIICIITVLLLIVNFNNYLIEPFLGCYKNKGNISSLTSTRTKYNNMNNNGRLQYLNRGPVLKFHQQFTNGELPPELLWRNNIEKQMNNISSINELDGKMIQHINPINNIYENVNY
jgi:hypothetical protein